MERKIGEIFEFGGEWYQCIIGHCNQCSFDEECSFNEAGTCKFIGNSYCAYRNDKKLACFKKLEKVGEPYTTFVDKTVQNYLLETAVTVPPTDVFTLINNEQRLIAIEIKQNKEDMEDLDKIKVRDYTKVEELNVMEEKKLNLKPFDIQKAREGKPVCTRDGRKARIICFDVKGSMYPIIALIEESEGEKLCSYMPNGRSYKNEKECIDDLMMLPEKKERWVNVYKERCYESKEEAIRHIAPGTHYIGTIKVEWEE